MKQWNPVKSTGTKFGQGLESVEGCCSKLTQTFLFPGKTNPRKFEIVARALRLNFCRISNGTGPSLSRSAARGSKRHLTNGGAEKKRKKKPSMHILRWSTWRDFFCFQADKTSKTIVATVCQQPFSKFEEWAQPCKMIYPKGKWKATDFHPPPPKKNPFPVGSLHGLEPPSYQSDFERHISKHVTHQGQRRTRTRGKKEVRSFYNESGALQKGG